MTTHDTLSNRLPASAKLFITYLRVFLVTSFIAGVFLFLYSAIKTNNISSEFAFSLIATLSLSLQVFTVWYLFRRDRMKRPTSDPSPQPKREPKAHMGT
jgi:ABC-type dipeptide/oligopeptide/nickel transport system permease component